jgi:O-antigen ligase
VLNFIRRIALILVGVTLPFEYTRVVIAGFPLTPNKVLAGLLLVYVAMEWAAKRRRLARDPKLLWILFFGVATAIAAIPSYAAGRSLAHMLLLLTTVSTLILFYLILTYTVRERADLDLLLASLVVGCVLAAASGWLGYGAQTEGATRYGDRLTGEGANPNLIAFNLIVAIPTAASLMFTTQRGWVKPLYFAAIGIMIAACLSTLSRTAFVALPTTVGFWAFRFRRFNFLRYAVPVFLLVVAAAIFAPEGVVLRFQDVAQARSLDDLDASARDRFLMLPGMLRAFASNPVTGVGLHAYRAWALENGEVAHGIHNAYLQVLVEQGLVSFVPFMVVLVLTWRGYTAAFRASRRLHALRDAELGILGLRAALLQASLTGALVMALGQPATHHKGLWLLFATSTIVMALVRERVNALESPEKSAQARQRLPAGASGEWVPRPVT